MPGGECHRPTATGSASAAPVHLDNFQVPAFRRLLLNGVYWAAGLEIPQVDVDGKLSAAQDSATNSTNQHE